MNERIAASVAPPPEALSLHERELDKKNATLRRYDIEVRCWVHFDNGAVEQLTGKAVAYTAKCVFFEGSYMNRKIGVWVWATAVERVQPRELT